MYLVGSGIDHICRYSSHSYSYSCCQLLGGWYLNSINIRRFKSDRGEILQDRPSSKYASIDRDGFLIWRYIFKMTAMTSARRSLLHMHMIMSICNICPQITLKLMSCTNRTDFADFVLFWVTMSQCSKKSSFVKKASNAWQSKTRAYRESRFGCWVVSIQIIPAPDEPWETILLIQNQDSSPS